MRTNAKAFRIKSDQHSHDEICLFVHFIPEFKKHTTTAQFDDLYQRLVKGYLDKELSEKVKLMDPELRVFDFRFLSNVAGQQLKVPGQRSTNTEVVELQAEQAELNLFSAKLGREVTMWTSYRRNEALFEQTAATCRRESQKQLQSEIDSKAESFTASVAPVRRLADSAGVLPELGEFVSQWTKEFHISADKVHTCFMVRFDVLGNKFQANMESAIRIISDAIATEPERTMAVVFAPNTGMDEAYNDAEIQAAIVIGKAV